jgi:hypothetical protein
MRGIAPRGNRSFAGCGDVCLLIWRVESGRNLRVHARGEIGQPNGRHFHRELVSRAFTRADSDHTN